MRSTKSRLGSVTSQSQFTTHGRGSPSLFPTRTSTLNPRTVVVLELAAVLDPAAGRQPVHEGPLLLLRVAHEAAEIPAPHVDLGHDASEP